MTTTIKKTPSRHSAFAQVAARLVLDPPFHSGLGTILLGSGKYLVGASPECAIRLRAEGIEDRHALILVGEHRTILKALDPRTWLNDGPVTEMALRPGDRLSIGPLTFRVRTATRDELASLDVAPELDPSDERPSPTSEPDLRSESSMSVATTEFVETTPLARSRHAEREPTVTRRQATLDSRLEQVQRYLDELDGISSAEVADATGATANPSRQVTPDAVRPQPIWRHDELQRRVDEIAKQTQLVEERIARVADREAEVERQRRQLDQEAQRLSTVAETARRNLGEEHARQSLQWQEWDAAYRRMTGELASQFEEIERQRLDVQVQVDRLAANRADLDRLQANGERIQRECAAEKAKLATEAAALQKRRIEHVAEHEKRSSALDEREQDLAAERRELLHEREELLAARQELERERTSLLSDRSAHALRLEQELRTHADLRARLDEDRNRALGEQRGLEALRQEIEKERDDVNAAQARAIALQAELTELTARLQQAENELIQLRQHHDVDRSEADARRQEELQERAEETAALQKQPAEYAAEQQKRLSALDQLEEHLSAERRELLREREEILAVRQELESERASLLSERSAQASRLQQELLDHTELRTCLGEDRTGTSAELQELDTLRQEIAKERDDASAAQARTVALEGELAELTTRLQQAEDELVQLRQHQVVDRPETDAPGQEELRQRSELIEGLEERERRLQSDSEDLNVLRGQLDAERMAIIVERSRPNALQAELLQLQERIEESGVDSNNCQVEQQQTQPLAEVDLVGGTSELPAAVQAWHVPATEEPPVEALPVVEESTAVPDWPNPLEWNVTAGEKQPANSGSLDEWGTPQDVSIAQDEDVQSMEEAFGQIDETPVDENLTERRAIWSRPYPSGSHGLPADLCDDDVRGSRSPEFGMTDAVTTGGVTRHTEGLSSEPDPWPSVSNSAKAQRALEPVTNRADLPPTSSLDIGILDRGSFSQWGSTPDVDDSPAAAESNFVEAITVAVADLDAKETLDGVNQQFGVPVDDAEPAEASFDGAAMPSWWSDDSPNIEEDRTADSPGEPTGQPLTAVDSIDDLRSKLASLFDLPPSAEPAAHGEIAEDEVADESESVLMTSPAGEDSGTERSLSDLADETEPTDDSSTSASATESPKPGSSDVVAAKTDPSESSDVKGDEAEDSVDAFMARLLARSRGESSPTPSVASVTQATQTPIPVAPTMAASNVETPIPLTADPPDRSHLTAEPIHRQDRDVVRENLQSFRQVAQLSARSALAKHTSAQLRNATIAKGVLAVASAAAAVSFLGAPLVGAQPQIWNGVACSVATLIASIEFARSWWQLRRPIQAALPVARPDDETSVVEETSTGETAAASAMEDGGAGAQTSDE